jgi:hypothetical protein
MALRQRFRHAIDEDIVVEQRVDLLKSHSLSASGRSTSIKLRCRYARRTMVPPLRRTA